VQVQVVNSLPAIRFAVDHEARALFGATILLGQLLGLVKESAKQGEVSFACFHDILDVSLGYHKEVYRGHRGNIVKGENFIVLIYFL
jgi:hypothetical protein